MFPTLAVQFLVSGIGFLLINGNPKPHSHNSCSLLMFHDLQGSLKLLKANPSVIFQFGVKIAHKSSSKQRASLVVVSQASSVSSSIQAASEVSNVRFRLNNLGPQPGSKKNAKRKGRGHSAGQGGSCGFGMRGQKSRSGPGVRKGFEGGQMPLYRRIPKLRGIAGGDCLFFSLRISLCKCLIVILLI